MIETPSMSAPNRKVFDALARADKPLSAYDILNRLRRNGVRSPPTVYRALDWLVAHGFAHRLESVNAYIACQHHHGDGMHAGALLLCTVCGSVREVEDESLSRLAKKLSTRFLTEVNRQVIELSGVCHACCKPDTRS